MSTITQFSSFKVLEQDIEDKSIVPQMVFMMMSDLAGESHTARAIANNIGHQYLDADKVTFISAYQDFISPVTYTALALVKWVTPSETTYLSASDFCIPLFIASRVQNNTEIIKLLEAFIVQKAESYKVSYETMKEIYNG